MDKILVLGVGNRLMGDDGIGLYVVEKLMQENKDENVRYIIGETDMYFCLEKIKESEKLIIVDAMDAGENPGDISIIRLDHSDKNINIGLSHHNLHLIDLMKLHNIIVEVILIGIKPFDISFKVGLSSVLLNKLKYITKSVYLYIHEANYLFLS